MGGRDYCDLNIPLTPQSREVCERAIKMGYRILALNTPIIAKLYLNQGGQQVSKKAAKKRKFDERSGGTLSAAASLMSGGGGGGPMTIPPPQSPPWVEDIQRRNPGVRILNRLTVIFKDIADLNVLNHKQENVKLYDILAVVPTNHEALQSCLTSLVFGFDIISFDFEGSHWINKLRLNRQKGNLAIEREIFFEITYSASFRGDSPLENMIYTGKCLTEDIFPKRIKNIILSSGAGKDTDLRAPKDLTHLGFLLGLDETSSRVCFREHCHRIVGKADARKYGKSWVAFVPHPPTPQKVASGEKVFGEEKVKVEEMDKSEEKVVPIQSLIESKEEEPPMKRKKNKKRRKK